MHADIIVLIIFMRSVVNQLIKPEGIATIKGIIFIFGLSIQIIKNQIRNLILNLSCFNVLPFNLATYFLLFLCQENVVTAMLLHQGFFNKDLQSSFYTLLQLISIFINIIYHQTGNIRNSGCLKLFNVLNKKQHLEHVYSKTICFASRINILII